MTNPAMQDCWLIDLDGVVWLADDPIPGAGEAVTALRQSGHRVTFFTNNSFSTKSEMIAKFTRHGIELDPVDLLSSAQAAAALLPEGSRATVLGGAGITEALEERNVEVIDLGSLGERTSVDAVVIGLDRDLNFDRLTRACRAIAGGATFLATNDDATYPTPDGVLPGGGALVAAVSYATRVAPVVAGKPYRPAIELTRSRLGEVAMVVGDRPETDGEFARGLGARFGIVRSGVTKSGEQVEPPPDFDESDLAAMVACVLGTTRQRILSSSGLHS